MVHQVQVVMVEEVIQVLIEEQDLVVVEQQKLELVILHQWLLEEVVLRQGEAVALMMVIDGGLGIWRQATFAVNNFMDSITGPRS